MPLRRGNKVENVWAFVGLENGPWRDVHTALRYVEADAPFGDWRRHSDESK
jgi:hypothetical protein